jgi:hypothetical protein
MPHAPYRPSHLLLPAALAILAALVFVREAMVQGKLLAPPLPDDINAMMDAAGRLNAFYEGGTRALIAGYIEHPPHTPFSTGLAFLSFLTFGVREWAPYAASAVVTFFFFAIVAWMFRALPPWKRAAVMIMLFPLPVVAVSIREFRPDLAAALLIALGALLAAEGPILAPSRRRAALIGAVFGAALLAKPSTFPVTLALFGLTIVAAGMLDPGERSMLRRAERTFRAGLAAAAALAIVTLPHFLLAARRTFGYMHSNIFGEDRDLWVVEGSRIFHLRYYLDGPGAQYQLGHHAWFIFAFAALALVLSYRWNDRATHRRWLVLFAVGGAAYVLATMNQVKQEFFGLPFQMTALFAALLGLRLLLSEGVSRLSTRIPWPSGLLIALAAASIVSFRFTQVWAPADRPATGMHQLRAQYDDLYTAIGTHSRGRPAAVFVTFNGSINWKNLQFRAHQDRMPLAFRSLNRARTSDLYIAEYDAADLIVVADPDHPYIWQRIQGAAFHAEVLGALRSRPDVRQVAELPSPGGTHRFYIFRRTPTGAADIPARTTPDRTP